MTAAAIIAALLLTPLLSKRNRYRLRTKWCGWRRYRAAKAWTSRGRFTRPKYQQRFRDADMRHTKALLSERELRAGDPEDFLGLTP